jgi:protein SCO1/2
MKTLANPSKLSVMQPGMGRALSTVALFGVSLILAGALPWVFWINEKSGYYGLETDYDIQGKASWLDQVLSQSPGEYHYLMFGFLNCTDTCPTQLITLIGLNKTLPDKSAKFVYVTLDPERDSPGELSYISRYLGTDFQFVRPDSLLQAQQATQAFRDYAVAGGNSDDLQHSGRLYLVGPDHTVRLVYSPEQNDPIRLSEDFVAMTQLSNAERPKP